MFAFADERWVVENFLSDNGKNMERLDKQLKERTLTQILNDRAGAGDLLALNIAVNLEKEGVNLEKEISSSPW